jgi:uncharacterized protein YeaO (DUF488 family)
MLRKSVWSPIDHKRDRLRILPTRFRGRRMPTNRYDVWMPSLAPSERIWRAGQGGRISWAKFAREYRKELKTDGPVDSRRRTIKNHGQKFTLRLLARLGKKGNVTLMCHCAEDQQQWYRHLLRETILKA